MGFVSPQRDGDTQVVVFTIEGEINQADQNRWNEAVKELKQKFPKVVGATLKKSYVPPPGQ